MTDSTSKAERNLNAVALVIGILIGTYSSIAIAAPILVAYQDWRGSRGKRLVAMPAEKGTKGTKAQPPKVQVKA